MDVKPIFLVLVDISGYTRFVRAHRLSLLHAERIITDLLESVIGVANDPLVLHELEGDAVNFYALSDGSREMASGIGTQVLGFLDAFRARERELISDCGGCDCEACENVGRLRMKAVLHHGEAAFTKVRRFQKIGGEDVILAHRLLKNSVPGEEYVLLTEPFANLAGGLDGRPLEDRSEYCEGLGEVPVKVHYTERPEELPAETSGFAGTAMKLRLMAYSARRLFRPSPRFRHLRDL